MDQPKKAWKGPERRAVSIREVGPREGLQADPSIVPTETKVELLRLLIEAGLSAINAVSLVHPKIMPQMADAEEVLEALGPQDVRISALTPNRKAVERAVSLARNALLDEVHLVHAASEAVLRANGIDLSVDENLQEVKDLVDAAKAQGGLRVSVFVSAAFGCSIAGRVDPNYVNEIVSEVVGLTGVDEVIISDSTGQADPVQVEELLDLIAPTVAGFPTGLHFHDSRGSGTANVLAAVRSPIEDLTLDTSFGGLGGDIPFLPEAAGNVATEDTCEMLHGMGIYTGVTVPKVVDASKLLHAATGRLILSKVYTNGPVAWKNSPTDPSDEFTGTTP